MRGLSLGLDEMYTTPSTGEETDQLNDRIQSRLFEMLERAALGALKEWGADVSSLTHVVFGTATSGGAPSHEVSIIERLKLPSTVQRVSIDHMGAVGSHRAMALASQIACASGSHRILVVYGDAGVALGTCMDDEPSKEDIEQASLLADGAAAAVIGAAPRHGEQALYEVHAWKSHIIHNSRNLMSLTRTKLGVELSEHKSVPAEVGTAMSALSDSMLLQNQVSIKQCAVLLHPSSKRSLETIHQKLGIDPEQTTASWMALEDHGDVGGSSSLQMLDWLRKAHLSTQFPWALGLSYGPGLTIEGTLLKLVARGTTALPTPVQFVPNLGPPCVFSMKSSWPPAHFRHKQADILEALLSQTNLSEEDKVFAESVYKGTQVKERGLCLPLEELYTRPASTEAEQAQLKQVGESLFAMLLEAANGALLEWGGERSSITHLVFGSLSNMNTPGHDLDLALHLNFPSSVERVCVDHMGCLGGFRVLALASQLAAVNPKNRVLVVYGDVSVFLGTMLPLVPNKLDLMSVSLFADGAAACVVGTVPLDHEHVVYEVHAAKSELLAKSRGDMYMKSLSDGSVENVVTPRVPIFIGKNVERFVEGLLDKSGVQVSDCAFLCHPGGKTILETVEKKLGLAAEQTLSSWSVLRAHGNMTGATNLQVADHFRSSALNHKFGWAICMSFGPGLGMEGLLLRIPS
eukprot:CAMPEP_0196575030 /NCGR_PEP_ID=MMETSP1081-20130531/4600_1 /TAXON_ID=36882 /ORGANISM="Pyramimonas amylifera, Strain CCMP720" /LENGTH=689 /DNA_ID=CAMNT_0041893213 /DNA_START=390 /DNA_END=2459 /DNA_ORIENTATION=+